MLIYLASRYSRYLEMQQVRSYLTGIGHTITCRWIDGNHQISDKDLSEQAKESVRIRFATEDYQDLCNAEAIIVFTEPPRSTNSRGGRHVELGIALGLKMKVIVIGPRENIFCCLPEIDWFPDYTTFKESGIMWRLPR